MQEAVALTDWIERFDAQRRQVRQALDLVEAQHPDLSEECLALREATEAAFDRVLEDPSRVPAEAGRLRVALEALMARTKAATE